MWLALIVIALANATICYFLVNPELNKKEGHRRRFYEAIANFMVQQGETYDWASQLGSQNNDVDIYQEDYDSDEEDDEVGDIALCTLLQLSKS
jgi:hypothetical protein